MRNYPHYSSQSLLLSTFTSEDKNDSLLLYQFVATADIYHFGMKPSIKLLHSTHPGILTVIHALQWKMHFQGHSVQCVTVVKNKMQLSSTAPTPE